MISRTAFMAFLNLPLRSFTCIIGGGGVRSITYILGAIEGCNSSPWLMGVCLGRKQQASMCMCVGYKDVFAVLEVLGIG